MISKNKYELNPELISSHIVNNDIYGYVHYVVSRKQYKKLTKDVVNDFIDFAIDMKRKAKKNFESVYNSIHLSEEEKNIIVDYYFAFNAFSVLLLTVVTNYETLNIVLKRNKTDIFIKHINKELEYYCIWLMELLGAIKKNNDLIMKGSYLTYIYRVIIAYQRRTFALSKSVEKAKARDFNLMMANRVLQEQAYLRNAKKYNDFDLKLSDLENAIMFIQKNFNIFRQEFLDGNINGIPKHFINWFKSIYSKTKHNHAGIHTVNSANRVNKTLAYYWKNHGKTKSNTFIRYYCDNLEYF